MCPCNKCGNQHLPSTNDDVKYDLVKYGSSSTDKVWDLHCESVTLKINEWVSTFQYQSNKELIENLDQEFIKSIYVHVNKSSNEIDEEGINIVLEDGWHIMEELVLKFSKKVQEAMNTLYMDVRIHRAYLHYKIIWLKGKS